MNLPPLTPHGPDFSFIDAVEQIENDGETRRIRAKKWLDPQLPFFADHFPGAPLMPGVLLIESGAQAAGILWGDLLALESQARFSLAQVVSFKIQRPVLPGQTILVHARLERDFGPLAQFAVEIAEGDAVVASGKIILAR
ncbi:3-hydroxyacyl-[acyl-carrier-protein] dehydratase [Verrucomicrobium sp. GAS474]|uniref:3-hydroxyacyl-ACP dehydratase FabZ family protein n=1 Tax=Verrucomicrobium sp. GAS474 TaxID=1882831 RepID=UPI00087C3807|nr:FabA/FabZ family ACP-dehydratase [Verrucomicrobium sp. GAS474]SDU05013.1 3-hydroxyacyl-[acyl-carrier-protein] dehydratase [Verrucomicrobium sp. GAS474]